MGARVMAAGVSGDKAAAGGRTRRGSTGMVVRSGAKSFITKKQQQQRSGVFGGSYTQIPLHSLVKLQPGMRLFPQHGGGTTLKKRLSKLRTALLTAAAGDPGEGGVGVDGGVSDDGALTDGGLGGEGEGDQGRCFTLVCEEGGRMYGFNLEVPVGGNGRSRDEWLQALKECWDEGSR